jgi:hypothetical protein
LNLLVYLKVELKSVSNTQNLILEKIDCLENQLNGKVHQNNLLESNYLQDYQIPIDGDVNFVSLEDKILGDNVSQLNLVCIIIVCVVIFIIR